MLLKKIQHQARYNNFVMDFADVLEEDYVDLRMFMRLLAMESDYKEWVEEQLKANPNSKPLYITEDMVNAAKDDNVVAVRELTDEMIELSHTLHIYIIDTPEINAEYN
jgi:hypothetical protein